MHVVVLGTLEEGRCVHHHMIQSGLESDVFVRNSLVDMYSKCRSMEDCWRVFNEMLSCDVVTWTTMILGHVKCGQGQKALELLRQMQQEGVLPDSVTFVGVLNAYPVWLHLKGAGVFITRSFKVVWS
jgi:pentatricopeptide repeat protein